MNKDMRGGPGGEGGGGGEQLRAYQHSLLQNWRKEQLDLVGEDPWELFLVLPG